MDGWMDLCISTSLFPTSPNQWLNQSMNDSILVRPEEEPLLALLPLGHALVGEGAPQQMANLSKGRV
jgi:hypothetical protein